MKVHTSETVFVGPSELATLMRQANWSQTDARHRRRLAAERPRDHPHDAHVAVCDVDGLGAGPYVLLQRRLCQDDARRQAPLGARPSAAREGVGGDPGPTSDRTASIMCSATSGEATWGQEASALFSGTGVVSPGDARTRSPTVPLHQDDGQIAGMFCVVTEETDRLIGERRLALLRELGAQLAASDPTEGVLTAVERSLASDARDFPFTLTYLLNEPGSTWTLAATSNVGAADSKRARHARPERSARGLIGTTLNGVQPVVVDLPDSIAWPRGPWQKSAEPRDCCARFRNREAVTACRCLHCRVEPIPAL